MYIIIGILIGIIIIQFIIIWHFKRQVLSICRQLSFLMNHDSNMIISHEFGICGITRLIDTLNKFLQLRKEERQHYKNKETLIADTYTNLSHDIRTPLTSLDGYFQLMEDCDDVDKQRRYMKIIQERISCLNDMLEELFTFTKLKNESYNIELMPCSINRVLKETVFSYYDEWAKMNIIPDISIIDEELYIQANRQGLRRIIQNVIKNGLDHGDKEISINLRNIDNNAVLRISNHISDQEKIDVTQVFERFYKADMARSRTSTGLGLSIARELVLRMNGDIKAEVYEDKFIIEINFPIVTDIVKKSRELKEYDENN